MQICHCHHHRLISKTPLRLVGLLLKRSYICILNLAQPVKKKRKTNDVFDNDSPTEVLFEKTENCLLKLVPDLCFLSLGLLPKSIPSSANAVIQSYFCLSPICASQFFTAIHVPLTADLGHTFEIINIMPLTIHFYSCHAGSAFFSNKSEIKYKHYIFSTLIHFANKNTCACTCPINFNNNKNEME